MPYPKVFDVKHDLKLISLVKEMPVLYDHNHPKYMDFNVREVVWQKIGDELKKPAADCKVRWINIRDVNRRMLRKTIANPGLKMRNYKYEREMMFMRPYYKDVVIPEDFDTLTGDYNDDQGDDQPDEDERDSNTDEPDDYEEKPVVKKPKRKRKAAKKKQAKKFEEEIEEPTFADELDRTDNTTSELDPGDPVDAFLLSIGATLKTFSPYHLNLAKSKIFAIVQEHDLQQIVHRQSNGHETHPVDVKVSTSDADNLYLQ